MAKTKDCPLFLHRNGQWCKKVRGKPRYFGTDKDAALKRWAEEKDYLLAGVEPPRADTAPSLKELGNCFAENCRQRVASGEIEQRTADEYEQTIKRLVQIVGRGCRPHRLTPMDYARIKAALAEPAERQPGSRLKGGRKVERRSPGSVGGDIRRLRVFLNWCWHSELIENAPRYGKEFSPPSRKAMRRKRAAEGRKDLSADDIRAILAKCRPAMKAIVLLGINGAVGNQDVSDLQMRHLPDLGGGNGIVDYPRGKTGAPRRFWLWPETVAALKDYLAMRPEPATEDYAAHVFLTRLGQPWVRRDGKVTTDSIGFAFTKARKAAGVDRGVFYDLRRTFRTVASQTLDREAVDLVMGHAEDPEDMGHVYNQHIDDSRIRAVCDHVRAWLYPTAK